MALRYYQDEAIRAATIRVERITRANGNQRARYSRASGRWTLISGNSGLNARIVDVPPTSNWGRQFQAILDAEQSKLDERSGRGSGGNGGGSGGAGGSGGRRSLFSSVVGSALGAGGGVLGGAASLVGGVATRVIGGVASGLVGGALGVLGTLSALLRAGLGAILGGFSSLLGGIAKAVLRAPGALLSGLGKISGVILGALGHVARSLAHLLSGVLKGALVGLGAAVAGLAVGLSKVTSATTEAGRSMRDLSASTGLSPTSAGGVQARFGVLGLDASKLMAGRNPAMSQMMGGAWGVSGYQSPNFLPSAAAKFQGLQAQGGIAGPMMAQNFARSMGLDSPEALRTLSMPVGRVAEQQRFAGRTQKALGVDPARLADASRDWDLLTGKVKFLSATILQSIGVRLLPTLNGWLEGALRLFEHFSSQGGDLIGRGVEIFVSGVGRAFEALLVLGRWLYADAPALAYRFADSMLSGLSSVVGAVPLLWQTFLHGIDFVQSILGPGLDQLAQIGTQAFDVLARGALGAAAGIGEVVRQLPQIGESIRSVFLGVLDTISQNPLVQQVLRALPAVGAVAGGVMRAEETVRTGAEGAANAVGVSPAWSALIGLVSPYLALRAGGAVLSWGARALLGGAAGAAGAGAAGAGAAGGAGAGLGLLGGASAGAVAASTVANVGAATAVGYAAYKGGQAVGLIDREQSFTDRMATGWGRLRSFFSLDHFGDASAYDREVNERWAQENRARIADEQRTAARAAGRPLPSDASGQLQRSLREVGHAARSAYQAPDPLGTLRDLGSGMAQRAASGLAQRWSDAPRGSWAQGLDDKLGAGLSQHEVEAQVEIKRLQDELHKRSGLADAEGRGQEWDEQLALLRQIAGNTGQKSDPVVDQLKLMIRVLQSDFASRLIGEVERRRSVSEATSILGY